MICLLIKKIFGSCAAVIPITNADRAVLSRHGFMPLEHSTISQINKQIELKEGTVEELAEEIVARLKSRNVL